MKVFDTYEVVNGDWVKYKKKATTMMVQMDVPFQVRSKEGLVVGKAGDFLVRGIEGELYVIDQSIQKATYEKVETS